MAELKVFIAAAIACLALLAGGKLGVRIEMRGLLWLFIAGLLIVLAIGDVETRRLPNPLVLALYAAAVAFAAGPAPTLWDLLRQAWPPAAAVGAGVLLITLAESAGRSVPIGMGDVKAAAALLPLIADGATAYWMMMFAGLAAIGQHYVTRHFLAGGTDRRVPFMPGLAIGLLLALAWQPVS